MKRLSVWFSGLLLLVSFLLAGCGELEFGVETRLTSGRPVVPTVVVSASQEVAATQQITDNMVLVTVTPSAAAATGTVTPTPLVTETATATATSTATPTETATPTAMPSATARPFVPTATPKPPQISSFTAFPPIVTLGGTISANWTAEGVSALLCLRFASGYTDNCYDVTVSGSRTLVVESDFREDIVLDLYVYSATGAEALSSIYIPLDCPDDLWFFDDPPSSCPRTEAVDTYAAAQHFEGGWMLWLEETDMIYAFYEPSRQYTVFYSGFGDPEDPAADNSDYDPPDGFYVPKRGFGLAWHNYSYVREMLGWALEPEFGFTTTYQSNADPIYGRLYVLDPDGRLVVLDMFFQTWSYR